jgi:hypothetical protein
MLKLVRNIMVLFVALILLVSCQFRMSFNPEDGFEGRWHAEFTAIYIGTMVPETDSVLTINHSSDMYFKDGRFEVVLDPPAPPLLGGMGEYSEFWSGDYSVTHDTLIMIDDLNEDAIERYKFEIRGDTLSLAYIPSIMHAQDGEVLSAIPLYGGLPWGRAFMWHAGDFYRTTIHNKD